MGLPARLEKKAFAFNALLRRKSKALPWIWFVPERVTTLTTAPPVNPYSALKLLVCNLNSWTSSTVGRNFTSVAPPPCSCTAAVTPSISTSDCEFRTPFEMKLLPVPPALPTTPGAVLARSRTLREISGMFCTDRFSTTSPSVALTESSRGVSPATTTLVVTSPTLSTISTSACCWTCNTTPERTDV